MPRCALVAAVFAAPLRHVVEIADMHLDTIPRKTDLARNMLQGRDTLPRAQRLFLIMIDGRKSLRELSEPAARLGIDNVALASLANAGLIHWSRDEASPLRTRAELVPTAETTPASAERGIPLVAVKLYAMDLVALMLPGQDHDLRTEAREVGDADAMRAWLLRCADEIARRSDADRAELFRVRVASQLPANFLAAVAA